MKVVSHGLAYQKPFYTLYLRGGPRDRGVNASGDAHPADKVREQAKHFGLFSMSGEARERKVVIPGVNLRHNFPWELVGLLFTHLLEWRSLLLSCFLSVSKLSKINHI